MFKISRKKLIENLSTGEFVCSTAFRKRDNTFSPFTECGKRTLLKTTSYGCVLLCGAGSPHVGAESDLRFEKGDICFESIDGNLFVVGSHVTIKYVKQVVEQAPKRTTIEPGDTVKYSESALRNLRDAIGQTGNPVDKANRQRWYDEKKAERGTLRAIETNEYTSYYVIDWNNGSKTESAKHLICLAEN